MAAVSEEQISTRRRALGRRLNKLAGDLHVIAGGLDRHPDLMFLSDSEGKSLAKQVEGLERIAGNFEKLRQRLEG